MIWQEWGSPPHMQGKAQDIIRVTVVPRITPAYARKSETAAGHSTAGSGSPPRMRGKVLLSLCPRPLVGITPAYAGKSSRSARPVRDRKDHPRVCGEKFRAYAMIWQEWGSPPRMRGKACGRGTDVLPKRITPAYAGKRALRGFHLETIRDHPRICGEKGLFCRPPAHVIGSPPHMRGKVIQGLSGLLPLWDHPRICGEKFALCSAPIAFLGSPPHMRGKVALVTLP